MTDRMDMAWHRIISRVVFLLLPRKKIRRQGGNGMVDARWSMFDMFTHTIEPFQCLTYRAGAKASLPIPPFLPTLPSFSLCFFFVCLFPCFVCVYSSYSTAPLLFYSLCHSILTLPSFSSFSFLFSSSFSLFHSFSLLSSSSLHSSSSLLFSRLLLFSLLFSSLSLSSLLIFLFIRTPPLHLPYPPITYTVVELVPVVTYPDIFLLLIIPKGHTFYTLLSLSPLQSIQCHTRTPNTDTQPSLLLSFLYSFLPTYPFSFLPQSDQFKENIFT
ncbi:MAG: hypothetical protein JOS17DRAFT_281509 [Linnemannia elongata]|nr:MAG: hypothetical protein JOS17DRAFT_281509 [Linnemannia elongata]